MHDCPPFHHCLIAQSRDTTISKLQVCGTKTDYVKMYEVASPQAALGMEKKADGLLPEDENTAVLEMSASLVQGSNCFMQEQPCLSNRMAATQCMLLVVGNRKVVLTFLLSHMKLIGD